MSLEVKQTRDHAHDHWASLLISLTYCTVIQLSGLLLPLFFFGNFVDTRVSLEISQHLFANCGK